MIGGGIHRSHHLQACYKTRASSRLAGPVLIRLQGIALDGAPAGDYELVLRVRDEIARRTVEVREPFQVDAARPVAHAPGLPPS